MPTVKAKEKRSGISTGDKRTSSKRQSKGAASYSLRMQSDPTASGTVIKSITAVAMITRTKPLRTAPIKTGLPHDYIKKYKTS